MVGCAGSACTTREDLGTRVAHGGSGCLPTRSRRSKRPPDELTRDGLRDRTKAPRVTLKARLHGNPDTSATALQDSLDLKTNSLDLKTHSFDLAPNSPAPPASSLALEENDVAPVDFFSGTADTKIGLRQSL